MRILYITRGDHVDYQNDCLLIGLKELFGSDVVDVNKQHHNYDSFPADYANRMYGRGFSLTRVLPDLPVDRTDILNKIRNRYFDFIIYGSIWRVPGSRQETYLGNEKPEPRTRQRCSLPGPAGAETSFRSGSQLHAPVRLRVRTSQLAASDSYRLLVVRLALNLPKQKPALVIRRGTRGAELYHFHARPQSEHLWSPPCPSGCVQTQRPPWQG